MRLKEHKLVHRGKVRDIYELPNKNWLFVATDRVSAYDVVLPTPIPERGIVLTTMSNYWMKKFEDVVPNHLVDTETAFMYGADKYEKRFLMGRSVEVRRLTPIMVEAIARGFITGSAWEQYKDDNRVVNGLILERGLQLSQRLSETIYTPTTKAHVGHDENISYLDTVRRGLITGGRADEVKDITTRLYEMMAEHTRSRGILMADTKLEFGFDPYIKYDGPIYLMDEIGTPDSSRYWEAMSHSLGVNPPSYDKQILRDWLDSIGWDRKEPAPEIPESIVQQIRDRYFDALRIITSESI